MIIDGNQLLYHIVWPAAGKVGDVAYSMTNRIDNLYRSSETFIIFDCYEGISVKEHECQRHVGEGSKEYNIELGTTLAA